MKLHELSPAPGSTTPAWRKGRGTGSGNGKTAGKGHKGQNARSGGGVRPGLRRRTASSLQKASEERILQQIRKGIFRCERRGTEPF